MADNLKLMALDADDLLVISAHVQDSVLLSAEIEFDPQKGLLFLPINRFAWEAPSARRLLFSCYTAAVFGYFARIGWLVQ